ncbi:MAG TPA: S24 family peptidase [Thermoanaerobaculia bacterium]|nr:S24 family peptidase [Thermoanaerobaculia bacterium]
MSNFGERLGAAIEASGKSRRQVADEVGTTQETISRLVSGAEDNPKLKSLIRLATAANTTAAGLLTEGTILTPEDERVLVQLRRWIDEKLADLDAVPNAIIVESRTTSVREVQIADRPVDDVRLVLSALGDSMIGAGIRADDTLHAIPAPQPEAAVGKIIACRIGESIFVKRLVSEHGRRYLVSAHPRYRAIAVDTLRGEFEILGVVIGRTGLID